MERDHLVGQQLGQYELLSELGTGTYASVYQAFQPRLRRYVAIKALYVPESDQADFIEQFEQIAQAIAQLNHPNIASIYDFGEEQGLPYIVMQSVTGGSFRKRLGKPMAVGEAVTPIIQLARALHHAHQRGVLHLDVRPENILIDQENESHLLLTDFSLSQLFQSEYHTRTGLPIGSPAYLAPEQIESRPLTARTDVYALGALLFEALAGKPAFSGPSPAIILNKHLHEPPPYIRGFNPAVPRELAHIVARALGKQPGERYESAEEFARALEPYRDARERQHRLHLTLDDLNIIDDDEPEIEAQAPQGAPSRKNGQSKPGTLQFSADPSSQVMKPAIKGSGAGGLMGARAVGLAEVAGPRKRQTEPPALPATEPVIAERVSLVNLIGNGVLRMSRRAAGKTQLGHWLDAIIPARSVQSMVGIGTICLALFLSLSVTLLAVSAPAQGSNRNASLSLSANQPTPTDTATSAPTAQPSPIATATPGGPTLDPVAAAAISRLSAAPNSDTGCQINPQEATLPAGRAFYVTVCFNPQAIPGGGTASITIFPKGSGTTSATASAKINGGDNYYWFQLNPLTSGNYMIEVFWNGKLGRTYLLTIK